MILLRSFYHIWVWFHYRFAFGRKESETFSDALTHVRLPGLNNLDQMYLMALANTVANTQTDFSDKFTDVKQTTTGNYHTQNIR